MFTQVPSRAERRKGVRGSHVDVVCSRYEICYGRLVWCFALCPTDRILKAIFTPPYIIILLNQMFNIDLVSFN